MKIKITLLMAFVMLQVLDVVTTQHVLAHGGFEANPVGVWTMATFGAYWPVPKLALMGLVALVLTRYRALDIAPFVVLMGIVVANNALWAYI